jgi:hypothetical protein
MQKNLNAQAGTQSLKYSYDKAGNRNVREVVISLKSMQAIHDTTSKYISDASVAVDNVNNVSNNQQNSDGNTNTSALAAGTDQYSDNIGQQKIIIYPNPTRGSLQIKITPFNSNASGEIDVYDLQSHLILKESCIKELTVVDLSKYAKGSYILKVVIGNNQRE